MGHSKNNKGRKQQRNRTREGFNPFSGSEPFPLPNVPSFGFGEQHPLEIGPDIKATGVFHLSIQFLEIAVKFCCTLIFRKFHQPMVNGDFSEGDIRRALCRIFALKTADKLYASGCSPFTTFLADEIAVIRSNTYPVPWKVDGFIRMFGGFDDPGELGVVSSFQPRYAGLLVFHFLWIYLATDAQLDDLFKRGYWMGSDEKQFVNRNNMGLLVCDSSFLTDRWTTKLEEHPLIKKVGGVSSRHAITLSTDPNELDHLKDEGFKADSVVTKILAANKLLGKGTVLTESDFKDLVGQFAIPVSASKEEMMTRSADVAQTVRAVLDKYIVPIFDLAAGPIEFRNYGTPTQLFDSSSFNIPAYFLQGLDRNGNHTMPPTCLGLIFPRSSLFSRFYRDRFK